MNTAQMNSSITEDNSAATISSFSSFLGSTLPKLFTRLEDHEEHKEFKDLISIVQDDDDDCSMKTCDLHHKTLDFLLSTEIERFRCNEGYQDHKDDSNEDSSHNKKGKAERDEEESHPLGSLIDTDGILSNCGSISCRSSSRRSFAFPILESEWPGSPVRMEEVDRRHRQRRRAWFLCF